MTEEQARKHYEQAIQRLAQAVARGCTLAHQRQLERALDAAETACATAGARTTSWPTMRRRGG